MTAIPLSHLAASRCWQNNFMIVLPAVKKHALIRFRRLPMEAREEATAEAIASACVSYASLARQKKLARVYVGNIATNAVRAVNGGRRVGGHINSRDVLSALAQKKKKLSVVTLSPWSTADDSWRDLAMESRKVSPADQACFNLDFQSWLMTWTPRHRKIITMLAAGQRTMAVARSFTVSEARVSQWRREFEESWQQFQGLQNPATTSLTAMRSHAA